MVAVEGLDGAGKATLVDALRDAADRAGASVHTVAFPRYRDDLHAALAGEALRGELGDVHESVHAMALLFALDRRAAAGGLRRAREAHDLVLVDRYVSSNAAYGAARLAEDADGPFAAWVRATEIDRFGVPVPDHQVLVRVPDAVAANRVLSRAAADGDRTPDGYETDAELQRRCAAVYDGLVTRCWLSRWSVLTPSPEGLHRTADKMVTAWTRGGFASGSSVRSDTIET